MKGLTRAVVLALSAGLLLSGCALSDLNFRQDHRLTMVAPQESATVTLPFTVSWSFADRLGKPGGVSKFAVFVDASPIAPGDTLDSLDRSERAAVVVTTSTSTRVPSLDTSSPSAQHDVTVVLLDAGGHRVGETAAHVSFYVTRATTT